MQNTQTLAKHTRDTVEILVSPMLIQTGKPDEAEVTICEACISTSYKCIRCGQKNCDLYSPDSEEKQSKRHCPTCFENREETKRRKPK